MSVTCTLLFHLHHETEAERSSSRAYAEALELIRQADDLPIETAWLAEHHLSPTRGRVPAPLLLAVAAGRQTRRVRVGPCVVVLPLHHPIAVAEQAAMVDLLTDGRLALGVGSGGNPDEFAAFGVPRDERRARFDESLAILSLALAGRPFSYSGAHYTVPEVVLTPAPVQQVAEMLWVAASSIRAAEVAGTSGGHLLLSRGMPVEDLRAQIEAYRGARASAGLATLPARIQVTRGVYVAETAEAAWHDAAEGIRRHHARLPRDGDEEVDLREMARRGDFIVGTPRQCIDAIGELCAQVPITHLACDISLIGMAHDHVARSLGLLGREVIPRLRF